MKNTECSKLKNEKIEDSAKIEYIGNQNTLLMKENAEKLTSIKSLKNENINLYGEYMNLRIIYELESKINKPNRTKALYPKYTRTAFSSKSN